MGRHTYTGTYYVGDDPRVFETAAAATSLALTKACRSKDDCSFYVREKGGQGAVVAVEKVGGIITAKRVRR